MNFIPQPLAPVAWKVDPHPRNATSLQSGLVRDQKLLALRSQLRGMRCTVARVLSVVVLVQGNHRLLVVRVHGGVLQGPPFVVLRSALHVVVPHLQQTAGADQMQGM